MFSPLPWSRNPFFTPLPSPSYQPYTTPPTDPKPPHHARRYNPRRHTPRRASFFSQGAIEGSEFSGDESVPNNYNPYYLSDNNHNNNGSTLHDHHEHLAYAKKPSNDKSAIRCKQVAIHIPQRGADTLGLRENDLLILAPTTTLMWVKVHIRAPHSSEKLRAAVAADVRLRDLVKQVLPAGYEGEVRVQVKVGGEWQEVHRSVKMEVVAGMGRVAGDERSDVEVKIVVGGGGRGGMGYEMGFRGAKGWEREEMMGMWGERVWMC